MEESGVVAAGSVDPRHCPPSCAPSLVNVDARRWGGVSPIGPRAVRGGPVVYVAPFPAMELTDTARRWLAHAGHLNRVGNFLFSLGEFQDRPDRQQRPML